MTSMIDGRKPSALARMKTTLMCWFDTSRYNMAGLRDNLPDGVEWARILPYILVHLACLGAIWTGVSTTALVVAGIAYVVRMFAITGFYHRYFSHRSFKTSRAGQFIFGLLGASAVQRGPAEAPSRPKMNCPARDVLKLRWEK